MRMRHYFLGLLFVFLAVPEFVCAQASSSDTEEMFRARVVEVLEQKQTQREDETWSFTQKLKLRGLEGSWDGKEIVYDGTAIDVLTAGTYNVGDTVIVQRTSIADQDTFVVLGYSRIRPLLWLGVLFLVVVIAVGKWKGVRSLFVLALTFLILLKLMIPLLLKGHDPVLVSILGSLLILVLAVSITEGFKRSSIIAIVSILLALIITGWFSVWFSSLTHLTGFASEESVFLMGYLGGQVDIKGLLLAGIIIGALGVLDDVVISQITLVQELKRTNPRASNRTIIQQAMRVGVSHMSSMVNTLFLAYAGASLPLLLLFHIHEPPFLTLQQIIDHEMVTTEIVRTITGSIGLVLSVPIATFLAARFVRTSSPAPVSISSPYEK
jgi:uncharacterized membrane protein